MAKSGNKWLGVAIIVCGFMWLKVVLCRPFWNVRNSLSIVFLAISDRLAISDFLNSLSIAILAISDRYRILLVIFCGHFGCQKITFDRISSHF